MKIIESSAEILEISGLKLIEQAGRTAYLSHDKINDSSAETFIESILKRGHESVVEHSFMSVKIISNIGFTREMNRHRLLAITEQSTRYVNLNKDKHNKEITVIRPYWFGDTKYENIDALELDWLELVNEAESIYMRLSSSGLPPEACRGVLPLDAKTEAIYSGNFREWRHIFKLRTSNKAHPEMRKVMSELLVQVRKRIPGIFDNII